MGAVGGTEIRMGGQRFSVRLREATRVDHGENEGSAYLGALLEGRLTRAGYALLAGQLHLVYEVLEEAADRMAADPVAGPFVLDDLYRRTALRADLEFFLGPRWAERVEATAAARAYRDRLREVCFDWPGGFVAHHYTRYMGDLSGGLHIGRSVARAFGLTGDQGVRFHRFPGRPKAYKDRYRELLDAAPWDEAEQDRIIAEVRAAYRLNAGITAELGRLLRIEPAA